MASGPWSREVHVSHTRPIFDARTPSCWQDLVSNSKRGSQLSLVPGSYGSFTVQVLKKVGAVSRERTQTSSTKDGIVLLSPHHSKEKQGKNPKSNHKLQNQILNYLIYVEKQYSPFFQAVQCLYSSQHECKSSPWSAGCCWMLQSQAYCGSPCWLGG